MPNTDDCNEQKRLNKIMTCIFCDTPNEAISIEHIVSESLGNKNYVMQRGKVCDSCNSRFSNFEGTALSNSIFVMERARFGIETKKGKHAKGKVNDLTIEGDKDLRPSYINVKGLNKENFKDSCFVRKTPKIKTL